MWGTFNSQITIDSFPTQEIAYMETIMLSPTRLNVVAETLKISHRVANECVEEYAVVTCNSKASNANPIHQDICATVCLLCLVPSTLKLYILVPLVTCLMSPVD